MLLYIDIKIKFVSVNSVTACENHSRRDAGHCLEAIGFVNVYFCSYSPHNYK